MLHKALEGIPGRTYRAPCINDLPAGLSSTARLFADDTACQKVIKVARDQDLVQEDLHKLALWEQKWKMSFHPEKCITVHMSRSRKLMEREYELHGHKLKACDQVKYLGITLTRDLKWSPHVTNITNKANRSFGFIRRNIKVNSIAIREVAYKALVRPTLEYSSSVWDSYTDKDIMTIEKVQRRAARWVCQRFRQTSSVGEMLESLQWETLQQRRKRARLITFFKIHHEIVTVNTSSPPTVKRQTRLTRNVHPLTYVIPRCRTTYRQMSFFPRTILEWNSLPAETVTVPSIAAFREKMAHLN